MLGLLGNINTNRAIQMTANAIVLLELHAVLYRNSFKNSFQHENHALHIRFIFDTRTKEASSNIISSVNI